MAVEALSREGFFVFVFVGRDNVDLQLNGRWEKMENIENIRNESVSYRKAFAFELPTERKWL